MDRAGIDRQLDRYRLPLGVRRISVRNGAPSFLTHQTLTAARHDPLRFHANVHLLIKGVRRWDYQLALEGEG